MQVQTESPQIQAPFRLVLAVAAALVIPATALAQPSDTVRLDGVAALVGGASPGPNVSVVLRSDVELRARLHMLAEMNDQLPLGSLPDTLLAATLDEIIGEILIAREAKRLRVGASSERTVARVRARILEGFGGAERVSELLNAIGASMEEIDAVSRRRARVEAFLQANLEGTTLVTEADVERTYETGEHPWKGRELQDVRELLRAWLARQALDRAVARWVRALETRTEIRRVAQYGDAATAG